MTVPASYTEQELKEYMAATLGEKAAKLLDWTVAEGHYDEAATETAFAYGVDDVAEVSGRENIRRLRAIARRELWRSVMQRTMHLRDSNTETGNDAHSQIYRHATEQFELASAIVVEMDAKAVTLPVPPASGALPNKYIPWGST